MSVRDCESKTVEKTGHNVGVLVVQYLKVKTLGRWLAAPGGRKVRSGSLQQRELFEFMLMGDCESKIVDKRRLNVGVLLM